MIVREHFVFWQQYKESDDAERYMTFYTIADWPYVSIIDPRTGENMVTWSKIEASTFPELITEFLSLHPNLESPAKEPPRKKIRSENILEMDEDAQMGKKNNNYSSDCPKLTIYIRGATLDFLLHISAHILVIVGFWEPGQKAKSCTYACYLCFPFLP